MGKAQRRDMAVLLALSRAIERGDGEDAIKILKDESESIVLRRGITIQDEIDVNRWVWDRLQRQQGD